MKEALYILGDVVHVLQRERGCCAIFLYSEGKLFTERMQAQFTQTDQALKAFEEGFARWQSARTLKPSHLDKLNALLKACLTLSEWRAETVTGERPVADAIGHYSHHLIGPLLQAMVEIALATEGNNPTCVSAYNAFSQWKERIGLERAIGAKGFVGYSFHNQEFIERVSFLLSEQINYQNTYLALANQHQKQLVQTALEECSACMRLEELHDALRENPDSGVLYDLTPEAWFDLVSMKIDALYAVEKKLVDTLSGQENTHDITTTSSSSEKETNNRFGEYDKLIGSLQLFSGLPEQNLQALLYHGQIREFNKGNLLFLEGEPANRLYIILKGWIKLFKGTASGEETILQMLSSGDAIMESAVFLNSMLPVSAQVVEDAMLLSIPAPVLREQIKKNNELAMNLLATMSHRSQGLIRQIENARLKSVDERIGWFLLKLLLEQGRISRYVELPYDKALIASYLDMKRETFSRALGRLKEKGFKVENDTVVAPSLDALCGFCDTDTAGQCALHKTSDCPNPQCDDSQIAYTG